MKFLRIEGPLLELAGRWLADESNYQWFDFGAGRQILTPALLQVVLKRPTHYLRIFTDDDGQPIGISALDNINRKARTATMWGMTGEKTFRSRGYATLALSELLTYGFGELGLNAINTWLVDTNPSRKVLERTNFRYVGRMRQCHLINGELHDRLFYDILASEHRAMRPEELQRLQERQQREREREQFGESRRAQ
jgi:ribosomal-protein-alanine N-acetyltransferase